MHLRFAAQSLTGVGAAERTSDVNAIAYCHLGYAFADRFDDPGRVGSRGVGQGRLDCVEAPSDVGIDRVDADRSGSNDNLTGPRR